VLFITPATNAKEAKDYFTRHMSTSDYYLRDATEVAGEWHGLGAELLGLSGTIDKESYFKLCDNVNPKTGEPLTPRTKSERRVLYDFTFDAPKSVTLAYELGRDERIMDAFQGAYKDTMSDIEGAMMARVRTNGRSGDRATANMIWGEFIHRTTRPVEGLPDPHLHCHAVVFNATWDPEEEKFKAAQFGGIVRDRGHYQAVFHSRFAERLADLGYGIERDGKSFRLAGIDRETVKKFSRRTDIIEAEAKRLGITNPDTKDKLGRRTREQKNEHELPLSELRKQWKARLSDDEAEALSGARSGQKTTTLAAAPAMDYAVSHVFVRESAIPEKKLLEAALIQSVGAASVNDIRRESLREGILHQSRGGLRYVTTKDVLREEVAISAFVREGRGRKYKLGGEGALPALDPKLSKEQREAALVILNSRDIVTGLRGKAGTGKTTMIKTTVEAIEASGKKVFPFAPSVDAVNTLRKEGFANADTVERLLVDPQMQKQVKGQVLLVDEAGLLSTPDMKRLFDVAKEQDARVVLAGDSGQHKSVKRGDALRILEKNAGMKTAQLSEIRRQTDASYRKAIKVISEGDTVGRDGRTRLEAGMEMLDKMGAIVELEGDERYKAIAGDYLAITSTKKRDGEFMTSLVVSPTHREADRVTGTIRDALKAAEKVSGKERQFLSLKPLNLTEAQLGDFGEYQPGSVVQFHQNAKGFGRGERVTVVDAKAGRVSIKRANGSADTLPLQEAKKFQLYEPGQVALATGDRLRITMNGLVPKARRGLLGDGKDRLDNGTIYQVEGFTRQGDIKLGNGFVIPKNYGGITHGYVVTSNASQSKTVDIPIVALGSESFAAANREQIYVSLSRGREAVRVYTDDKEAMMDAIKRSSARLSATELMQGEEAMPARKPGVIRRAFERIQVAHRAYKQKLARLVAWDAVQKQQGEGRSLGR